MADERVPAKKKDPAIVPEVILEVKDHAVGERLVAVLQQEISMSRTSSPIMLGFILADEKLRKEFAEASPDFYAEVLEKAKKEADAHTKCMANEPEIANKAYQFATRGQLMALFLSLSGLFVAALVARWGGVVSAGWIGVASLAPGLISAFINRRSSGDHPSESKPVPQKNKGEK